MKRHNTSYEVVARWQRLLAAVTCCVPTSMRFVAVLLLCLCATTTWSQRFFNLTYDDVKIDSVLPHFGYSVSLGENYQDSVYDVQILYPEFIDATTIDVVRFKSLRSVGAEELRGLDVEKLRSFDVLSPLRYGRTPAGRAGERQIDNRRVAADLPEMPVIGQRGRASRG